MTTIKITFHEKLNAYQSMCRFVGTSHEYKEEIRGEIIFVNSSEENCNLCQDKISRDGYNEQRWATDRDGYLVCRTCCDKLGADNEICENCFCISCYAASDKFCDCALPKE